MRPAGIAIVIAAIVASENARATECPAPEGGSESLRTMEAERRLTYVEGALSHTSEHSAKWGGFWRAAFATAAAVQFSLSLRANDRDDRVDLVAGGIKASTGFLFALVFRLPGERHEGPWGDRPWEHEGALCARLASAESALARDAKFEKRGRSIGMHALGFGFNIAVGIVQYVLHKRLWSVGLTTLGGTIVGETRIFTQPTVATEAYDDYLAGKLATAKVSIAPTIVPIAGGAEMGLAVTF